MRRFLTDGRTLWVAGLAFAGLTVAFAAWIRVHDLHIIDETWQPDRVRALVGAMTAAQRTAHLRMTLTLDVAYPFAYGAFLSGVALRAFGRWDAGAFGLAAIPADLAEGAAQILVLSGDDRLLWLKAVCTPIKLVAFVAALLIALAGLLVLARRRLAG